MIMTSRINDAQTREFYKKNGYFGASKESVIFFEQAVLPAVMDGRILMESNHRIVMAPNGNGALFDAIHRNKEVKDIISRCEYVQVIGVDNVLNKLLDPVFVGFAVRNDFEAAVKCCIKRNA